MADEGEQQGAGGEQQGGGQEGGAPPEFLDQVIMRAVGALHEQAPELFTATGESAAPLAANAARLALWLAGLRPGGLRVLRLLSGYEIELTPQDPLGFVQHLVQALVGETMTNHPSETPEDAAKALGLEINNLTNQVTADITPFVVRALLWTQTGGPLQQALNERAEQQELASRRGTGKRDEPPAASPSPLTPDQPGAEPPAEPPAPPRPRLIRPGEPEDEGPPPPLIFPGRR